MRLSSCQFESIKQVAEFSCSAKSEVCLFGSCVEDTAKSGKSLSIDELTRQQGVKL